MTENYGIEIIYSIHIKNSEIETSDAILHPFYMKAKLFFNYFSNYA